MGWIARIRDWARTLKRDALVLGYAARDPRTPWHARALALLAVGYALSPIDLIPDFIPVLGFLDDAILLPVLIWLALRATPHAVLEDCRARAERTLGASRPVGRIGAVVIVLLWVAAALWLWQALAA